MFGLKPTFGLVPRSPGFLPPSWASLAHTGPIARTVADAALLLEIIAGYDARDPRSLPVARRVVCGPTAAGSMGCASASVADLGYAAVGARRARGLQARRSTRSPILGADMVADDPGLDPDILEHVLKPIAFTEQAAAVSERDPVLISRAPRRNIATSSPRAAPTAASDYMRRHATGA